MLCDIKLSCDIKLFADDTSILEIIHDPLVSARRINDDLRNISLWSDLWKVTFNATKSIAVLFSTKRNKQDHPTLYLRDTPIPEATHHTHLGITISGNLKWNEHINRIINKSNKCLVLLRRLKYKLSRKALIRLYTTMIRPILEYGCAIFDNCSDILANSLESVQYQAARICTGAMRHTPRYILLNELGWQTLATRRKYFKLVLFYKMLHNLTPTYLSDLVPHVI